MSYSTDLREKVIAFVESKGSITEGASIFGISKRTIYHWLKKKKTRGSLKDPPPLRPWRKLNPEVLSKYVKEHPDRTLQEYAQHFGTIPSTICEAFKRLQITRKKRHCSTKKEVKTNAEYFWTK